MIVEGKNIYIYKTEYDESKSVPLVIMNTFQGNGEEVYKALMDITDKDFTLAVVSDIEWDDEMSPWESPALFKGDTPCTGGADAYIDKLTGSIIPEIVNSLSQKPEFIAIAGYSLGGLFSIYSLYKTDVFARAVSASGSMWFPDFLEYVQKNEFKNKPDKVYFSLGDKEAMAKNQILKTVQDRTEAIYKIFDEKGIDTIFELNPGNHFKDEAVRMAKGINWILQ